MQQTWNFVVLQQQVYWLVSMPGSLHRYIKATQYMYNSESMGSLLILSSAITLGVNQIRQEVLETIKNLSLCLKVVIEYDYMHLSNYALSHL